MGNLNTTRGGDGLYFKFTDLSGSLNDLAK